MKTVSIPKALSIRTFNGANPGTFYVQRHGHNAGRPLVQPIPNCFTVVTQVPHAFQIAECLFQAGVYWPYVHGTAQQFIRLSHTRKLLGQALRWPFCPTQLKTLEVAQYEAEHARELSTKWRAFARAYALQLYFNAQNAATA